MLSANELSKGYSTPTQYLFERIEMMGVKKREECNDEKCFNVKVISRMDGNKLEFMIASKFNNRID
jgi:hypothetical protein